MSLHPTLECGRTVVSVLALWLVLSSPLAAAEAADTNAPAAVVLTLEGHVEILLAGNTSWKEANVGQPVGIGDQFRTGPRSRATVRLSDLSVLRLSELSTCEIQPP